MLYLRRFFSVLLTGAETQNNRLLTTVGFDQLLGEQITFAADLVVRSRRTAAPARIRSTVPAE